QRCIIHGIQDDFYAFEGLKKHVNVNPKSTNNKSIRCDQTQVRNNKRICNSKENLNRKFFPCIE
ncbi:unnamed protein product, partial [marine sediment metagenome]